MLKEGTTGKYFFLGLIIVTAIISFIIIFPFLTSIITGALLAFVFYPCYAWIQRRIKNKNWAAFITAVIIVLLVTIPLIFLINTLTSDAHYIYVRTKQQLFGGTFIESRCYDDGLVCRSANRINELMQNENVKNYVLARMNDFVNFMTKKVSDLIFSLPKILLHLLVVLFTTYYVLKDGKEGIQRAAKVLPLKVHHQDKIIKQFTDVTKAVIYGSLIVALAQGALGALGLWVFGIKSFLWWAIIMTFFALVPFIGTWVVWMPASLYLGISGYLQGETKLIWMGIGLFFYGLLIISTVDNFLKPIIVAGKARVHPLLILIGILGGLFVFGLIGLIIGPLILAILQNLLQIYETERKPHVGERENCILGRDGYCETHNKRHGHSKRRRTSSHSKRKRRTRS